MKITATDATLGAVIEDVDLAHLTADAWRAIEDAFHAFAVLAFPAAHLSQEEHLAFSRRFGPLERTMSQRTHRPEISLLSNVTADGAVAGEGDTVGLYLKGNRSWHTDSSFKQVAAKASVLRAIEVPDSGGDTEFADMRAAWDALSKTEQERLEPLVAEHSYAYSQGLVGGTELLNAKEWQRLPPVQHPVVRTHPATGRKSLYIGRHASHIIGMDEGEGRALLARLVEEACKPPRIFRHRWQAGDIVMWDNRCVLHRGHPWPFEQRRVMQRATVAGEGGENPWVLEDEGEVRHA